MTLLVVDASVASKWFFDEPHMAEALRLRRYPGRLMAPELMLTEVASVFWKRTGRGDLAPADATIRLQELARFPLAWQSTPPLMIPAFTIATTYARSVYDSIYVALAVREDARLVTADRRLFNALESTPLARYLCWIGNLPA